MGLIPIMEDNMINLRKINKQHRSYWQRVYELSFPVAERMSADKLFKMSDDNSSAGEAAIIENGTLPIGIIYYVANQERTKTLILYLAIDPDQRGGGLGSQTIEFLKSQFSAGIILESEILDQNANNASARKRRYDFYLRNGLVDSGFISDTLGGIFHLLRSADSVTVDDYLHFLSQIGLSAKVTMKD